jgi:hypothetical protein
MHFKIWKQMIIPLNLSAKFEIMGYEKLGQFFSSPNLNNFFERINDSIGHFYIICEYINLIVSFHLLTN